MIILKSPLNYRGTLIEKGSAVGFLPPEMQEKLIKTGTAERVVSEAANEKKSASEKPIDKMTKVELLEAAAELGISYVSEEMTKAEIIEAIVATQQVRKENMETDGAQQEEDKSPGKVDE